MYIFFNCEKNRASGRRRQKRLWKIGRSVHIRTIIPYHELVAQPIFYFAQKYYPKLGKGLGRIEKEEKVEENGLTNPVWFGNLTKLSGGTKAWETAKEKVREGEKKQLTKRRNADIIAMFRRRRHAPCKLNNVTKRKHQSSWSLWTMTKKRPKPRVESITAGEAKEWSYDK